MAGVLSVLGSSQPAAAQPVSEARAGAPDPSAPSDLGPPEPSESLVSADNPGFTNVTAPAPELTLITEQAVSLVLPDGGQLLALPQVLARLGLTDWLELRSFLPSAVVQFPDGGDPAVDVDHIGLGALAGGPLAPGLGGSITPVVFVPLGDDGVGVQRVEGFVQGNLSWALADRFALDVGVLGGWVQVPGATGDYELRGRFLGGALGSVSPHSDVSLYAESYAECIGGAGCEPIIGGGAAWWITPPLQVHLALSTGISDGSPPAKLTLGCVVRWW